MGKRLGRFWLLAVLTILVIFLINFASAGWIIKTIDSTGDVGQYSSIAIDSNNKVHISHIDLTSTNIIRYCNNTASNGAWSCAAALTTLSGAGGLGSNSIAVDSNNIAHISYYEGTDGLVYYCNNNNIGGSWSCTTLESAIINDFTSIAIDSNNKEHISYLDGNLGNLRYCNNTASNGAWSCTTAESSTGGYPSVAIDSNNKVHISHTNLSSSSLRYCNNTASSGAWSCTTVNKITNGQACALNSDCPQNSFPICDPTFVCVNKNKIGTYSSMAMDSNGKFHISAFDSNATALVYCNNTASNGDWSCIRVDSSSGGGGVGKYSSIAVDSNNKVHISEYGFVNSLNGNALRYCNNTASNGAWSCATINVLTSGTGVGLYSSIAVDSNNKVHISYQDGVNFDLRYATFDSINPNINITNPSQNNTNSSNTNLNVNFTFSDDGEISSCWYSNDTYLVNTTLANCINITTITWSEGKHNVTVYVNDTGNNLNFSTISFTIDTINPNLNMTFPTANNTITNNTNYNINYTASDINLASCWYSNDTYSINTTLANCGNLTTVIWSDTLHNVTIWANDSAGNLNSSTISFTIDTVSPTASFTCSPSSVNAGDVVTCSCSGSDLLSGVQVTSYTANPSTSTAGTFAETCTVTDFAGNQGTGDFSYTVNSSTTTPTTTTDGSTTTTTSGGGITIVPDKTFIISSIVPEIGVSISNFNIDSGIKNIVIEVKEAVINLRIKVYGYGSEPSEEIPRQELKTYKYFKINATSLENKLEKAVVTTRVEKTWIAENNLTKDGVSLFRLDETNNKWNEVGTIYDAEDKDYYYYQTELKSFSIFSISERTKNIVTEIIKEITRSYSEASRTFLGLLIWWVMVLTLLIELVLLSLLAWDFASRHSESISGVNYIKVKH